MTTSSSNSRPLFPPVIDSTMLSSGANCLHKLYRTYIQHWKPQNESVHLVAGGAFAKGVEVARKAYFERLVVTPITTHAADGTPHTTWTEDHAPAAIPADDCYQLGARALLAAYGAFEPPESGSGSAKTLERMLGALEFYFEQYPFGADGMEPITLTNGRRGIEFSFAEPLPVNHPVTGQPILFAGRADMIAHFAGGQYLVDEKTASSLGASWSKQWDMRGQFIGYQWAAGRSNIRVDGSIIRGISILKTKYETQQAIVQHPQWELDRWLDITCENIERWKLAWANNKWNQDVTGGACAEYGGCSLSRICKAQNPDEWLPLYYTQRVWDPLGRSEVSVAEWEKQWALPPTGAVVPAQLELPFV